MCHFLLLLDERRYEFICAILSVCVFVAVSLCLILYDILLSCTHIYHIYAVSKCKMLVIRSQVMYIYLNSANHNSYE